MTIEVKPSDIGAAAGIRFDKIAVAVDGTPESRTAVDFAKLLATTFGAEVMVLHFREKLVNRYGAPAITETMDEIKSIVGAAARELTEAGVTVSADVEDSAPLDEARHIAKAVEKFGCQLVIVGSRGYSTGRAVIQGSVSHDLIHATKLPLLIAR